jgi:branched-subunit amino acid ABC-type transport system permease component
VALFAASVAAQAIARSFPLRVESAFSEGLYPLLGRQLGRAAGLLPFSLAECLVLVAFLALLTASVRSVERVLRGRATASAMLAAWGADMALVAAIGYVSFLLLWGFNYARPPLSSLAALPNAPAPTSELMDLGASLVDRSNREREGLAEDPAGALRIEGGFSSVARRVAVGYEAASITLPLLAGSSARPKPVLLSPLLSRVGITGIYFPFTGEPNVNTTLPDVELPFSSAHEVAHQLGFAREDEANYVGYLACRLHPDADFRYAGLLAASHYVLAALHVVDRAAVSRLQASRSAAVLRDEAAIRAWIEHYQGRATEVGRRVNDTYLKAQGQPEGVQSYGRMVDLLIAERRRTLQSAEPPR